MLNRNIIQLGRGRLTTTHYIPVRFLYRLGYQKSLILRDHSLDQRQEALQALIVEEIIAQEKRNNKSGVDQSTKTYGFGQAHLATGLDQLFGNK